MILYLKATELTDGAWYQFQLIGHARAIANLSIGELTLDPINFNVTSGLDGLEGLQGLVEIDSIDVVGGTTEGLALSIDGAFGRLVHGHQTC